MNQPFHRSRFHRSRFHRSVATGLLLATLAACFAMPALAQVGRSQGVIDPNVATEAELAAVPGLGAELATKIREQRPFTGILELNALLSASMSAEQLQDVYRHLFIALDLDSATREEILLVPGVGKRMAHEFEEYRPYRGGLPQFRKEIGKYVDEAEVARLEQYVFVQIDLNTASDDDILSIPGLGKRMLHEFKEYRPYKNIEQFRKEIGKYVDEREVARLERYVTIR
jgi:DNA uptake protein ComE-like DNA-binding protein